MCFRPTTAGAQDAPLICPQCGSENAPGETKCLFCGADLPTSEPPAMPAAGAPAAPGAPSAPGAPAPAKAPTIPNVWGSSKKED